MNYPLQRRQPKRSLQEVFLSMAALTTPHGTEQYCWPFIPFADHDYWIDSEYNLHVFIPKEYKITYTKGKKGKKKRVETPVYSRIMWSSHLDGACAKSEPVTFRKNKAGLITTDGTTILGADCKIGAALMVKMIEAGVPGWYIFHTGEERGLIGARHNAKLKWPLKPDICVSFDRRGTDEIITHQGCLRTASDEFATAFAEILNREGFKYKPSSHGSATDSKAYEKIIPECTNIGVGYYNQHTRRESQDIVHAEKLLKTILKYAEEIENLPAVRDPNKPVYQAPSYTGGYKVVRSAITSLDTQRLLTRPKAILPPEQTAVNTAKELWGMNDDKLIVPSNLAGQSKELGFMCPSCNTIVMASTAERAAYEMDSSKARTCSNCKGATMEAFHAPALAHPTKP